MTQSSFARRRAIERLREGLFDPLAVRLLTAREDPLRRAADSGLATATEGGAAHLCVAGTYGYGKSHSLTYLQARALSQGFATSMIQLDPRETPFHDFRQVYRALFANLCFPDGPRSFTERWQAFAGSRKGALSGLLPEGMPFFFRTALLALAGRDAPLPRSFRALPLRALAGEAVHLQDYRRMLRLLPIPAPEAPATLGVKGSAPFLEMLLALSRLLREMGYRGLALFFDEGESILQARLSQRSRSYAALDHFFRPPSQATGLFSVFAFTDDFFRFLETEDYTRAHPSQNLPYFAQDYRKAWKELTVYRLSVLSRSDWEGILDRLVLLHSQTYGWEPPAPARGELSSCVEALGEQETRLKLKALVARLDILHQSALFA